MASRVLVTDVHDRAGLGACRSLRDAGYFVGGVASRRPAPGHWSLSCSERYTLVDPREDPQRYVDGIESIVSRRPYDALILGSDASLVAVSPRRAPLERHVRLGLPADEAVRRAMDKSTLVRDAESAGIACPETICCSSYTEALDAVGQLGFPLILKPPTSVFLNGTETREQGSCRVENEGELARMVPAYGSPFLLQRVEEGELYSLAGVAAAGQLLATVVSRYRRTWPVGYGKAAFSETVANRESLAEKVETLLGSIGWQGIFEVELIHREDGSFATIDVNPRLYGSIGLSAAAGAPIPAIWCEWLLGGAPAPIVARAGVRYRWEDADLRHGLWQTWHLHPAAALAVLKPHRHVVHAYARLSDPGPIAARVLLMAQTRADRALRRASRPMGRPRSIASGAQNRIATAPIVGFRRAGAGAGAVAVAGSDARNERKRGGPVAIVGAGPYGLATAAFLRRAGVDTIVFGRPLEFWRRQMPDRMLLRSRARSSSIANPDRLLGLEAWASASGSTLGNPISISEFIDYGDWFQHQAVPEVDSRRVELLNRNARGFELTLDDGGTVETERVVVAAGLAPFAHRPPPFDSLAKPFVSHSSEHVSFDGFAGRRVLVVGSGQSALESAALLHEAGAEVEVVARGPKIHWLGDVSIERRPTLNERILPPTDIGGRVTGWIAAVPDAYRKVPKSLKGPLSFRCIAPAGAGWLQRRLTKVPLTTGTTVAAAEASTDSVRLILDNGAERVVDHVLLGTGYGINVRQYPFFGEDVLGRLELYNGYPILGSGLESSVTGLYFAGAPAAHSFGPIMRFIVGSWYAAPAVCRSVLARRQPLVSFSF